ncbi:TauD/TfdA dioxygenase family protein [Rhodopila sp.]|uniref:TauD/TfdA dioxygenase family protein n=1 Tax=Rhodopila sp. TaxID=2480087 RepID=UPI002C39579F|nr:TauD/TfdA family dioxygenase [Rhodopila sp.]HVZ06680.1 TauD/TfdA family dioxygenase [Rhodopila sp.]
MNIRPLTRNSAGDFVGEVTGIDLAAPLSDADVAAIDAGMDRFAVLVFHDQHFDDDTQLAFSRRFGELEISSGGEMSRPEDRRLKLEMADISNLDRNSRLRAADDRVRLSALGNRLWHSDASFRAIPAKYSLLSARVVPAKGGNTEFADMRAAYETLDEATKSEIEDLITEHSNAYSRETIGFPREAYGAENQDKLRPVRHRLVRTHPVTGRKSLYLSAHIGGIVGWPMPEARAFIRDLTEHATQPAFIHAHAWREWDLVMWDNRTTMHRARRYDDLHDVRDMRRSTVRGDAMTAPQAQAA